MKTSNTISKKVFAGLVTALLGLAVFCTSARAQVLFNNGSASSSSATIYFADTGYTFYEAGNIFTPSLSGTANTVDFFGAYYENNVPSDNFTLTLDATSAGAPGAQIATSTLTDLSRTAVGTVAGVTLYSYSATLNTPLTLSSSSSYFLGFTDATSPYGWFGIATTTFPGSATSEYSIESSGPINATGISLAFELSDTQAAPEPSTYALLLGGLGLLAFMRTRRARI